MIGILSCFTEGNGEAVQKAKLSNVQKSLSELVYRTRLQLQVFNTSGSGLATTLTFFQIRIEN